jgi:colicin import membrane protein
VSSLLREHFGSVFWSVALHAAVIAALALGADFRKPPPPVQMLAIEAMVVDEALLARADQQAEAERQRQAELERQREEAEAERQRQADLERQRQQAEAAQEREAELERQRQQAEAEQQRQAELEQQRQEAEAEQQRQAELERQRQEAEAERQRQADLQRQREEAEAERQRQAELERQRQEAEAERQRVAEEERRRREAEAERQRQAELEAQLDVELQREAERLAAARGGALDEYQTLLRNRIEQNWIRPPSARPGIDCTVHVTQIPSGEVINARVASCNGDEAVVRSIEAAVLRASPLPLPSVPSLFERNLIIDFVPEE